MPVSVKPITLQKNITLNPADTFSAFIDGFDQWYPAEYTWSKNGLEIIVIEPGKGGRCFERGPDNFELDWGRVVTYEPPKLLAFTWQISANRVPIPNADKAGEVTIEFEEIDEGTSLTLKHHGFENYTDQPGEYRDALASQKGSPYIIDCFQKYCH